MKRGRFSEEQIIAILREHEAGAKAAELARKHGISEATLYNWKAKCGGIDVSEAKRLRMLEDENRKLKQLLAESMLDNAALKELLVRPGVARSFVLLSEAACVNVLDRDSPDDSRGEVNICAFPTFPQDRRELRTAAGTWGGRNGGRRIELVILPGIWTYSSRRLLWNR